MKGFTAIAAMFMGFAAMSMVYAACTALTAPAAVAVDACVPPDGARCTTLEDR